MVTSLTLNEKYNSRPAIRITAQLIQAVVLALGGWHSMGVLTEGRSKRKVMKSFKFVYPLITPHKLNTS